MRYGMDTWTKIEKDVETSSIKQQDILSENFEIENGYEDCILQILENKNKVIEDDYEECGINEQYLNEEYKNFDDDGYEDCLKGEEVKVLKRDEIELLNAGNSAINKRIEAKEDDYRDKGLDEVEIQKRLIIDRRNFQEEFLQDAFPNQEISPNIFNGFRESVERKEKVVDNIDEKIVEIDHGLVYEDVNIIGAFEKVPFERQAAIYNSFENAPKEIKSIVNDLSEKLSVEYANQEDGCHYDINAKIIRMKENMDDDEYSEVFTHEYGHFVDHEKGEISNTDDFRKCLNYDIENYNRYDKKGKENFKKMLNDLMSSDAAYDRAVSDNLSAFFKNDSEIVEKFGEEGISYYKHSNEYWERDGNREAEIYANVFSMLSQDNKKSCEFMQRYFPNTWDYVEKTLKGELR